MGNEVKEESKPKVREESKPKAKDEGKSLQVPFEQAKGLWQEFRQYASEVKIETKRVTWPSKQEIYGTTVMVVVTTFLFGIYFWICDQTFQFAVLRVVKYFTHRS